MDNESESFLTLLGQLHSNAGYYRNLCSNWPNGASFTQERRQVLITCSPYCGYQQQLLALSTINLIIMYLIK